MDYALGFWKASYAPWHHGLNLAFHLYKTNILGIVRAQDCIDFFFFKEVPLELEAGSVPVS